MRVHSDFAWPDPLSWPGIAVGRTAWFRSPCPGHPRLCEARAAGRRSNYARLLRFARNDVRPFPGASFDRLVGQREDGRGHVDTERMSRLEIDHQLEFRRLHHRQLRRLCAFEYASDINSALPEHIHETGTICD